MNAWNFVLNGLAVQPPVNWDSLEIELSFESDRPQAAMNATKLTWMSDPLYQQRGFQADAVRIIQDWIGGGLNSGQPGLFVGIPLSITVCTTGETVFNGIVDLSDSEVALGYQFLGSNQLSNDQITVKLIDKREDLMKELFESTSFAFLASGQAGANQNYSGNQQPLNVPLYNVVPGYGNLQYNIIPAPSVSFGGDFLPVSYQLNSIPDYAQDMIMLVTLMHVVKICEDILAIIKNIAAQIAAVIATAASVIDLPAALGLALAILEIIAQLIEAIFLLDVVSSFVAKCINDNIGPISWNLVPFDWVANPDCNNNYFCYTKFGMSTLTLCQRACAFFGMPFKSTILESEPYDRLVWLPAKRAWPTPNNTVVQILLNQSGITDTETRTQYDDFENWSSTQSWPTSAGISYGYPDGTIGEFFRNICDVFDARVKIIPDANGIPVVHLERWDQPIQQTNIVLPPVSDAPPFPVSVGTNSSEVASNYQLIYATDPSDYNTLYNTIGYSVQCQLNSTNMYNQDSMSSTLRGFTNRQLSCAQGLVKYDYTGVESIFNTIWGLFIVGLPNAIIGFINDLVGGVNAISGLIGIPPIPQFPEFPQNIIPQNKGVLQLYHHTTGAPKLLLSDNDISSWNGKLSTTPGEGSKLNQNNIPSSNDITEGYNDALSARTLFRNYHISSIGLATDLSGHQVHNNIIPNQWITFSGLSIPLCCSNFQELYNNNWCLLSDGITPAKITSLKWKPHDGVAKIDFRVPQLYTNNLTSTFTIDGTYNVGANDL